MNEPEWSNELQDTRVELGRTRNLLRNMTALYEKFGYANHGECLPMVYVRAKEYLTQLDDVGRREAPEPAANVQMDIRLTSDDLARIGGSTAAQCLAVVLCRVAEDIRKIVNQWDMPDLLARARHCDEAAVRLLDALYNTAPWPRESAVEGPKKRGKKKP
jgi:hypothetical protein